MSFSCSTSFSSYPSLTGWVSRSSTWHKSSFKIWPLLLPDSPSAYNPPTYLQFSHINTPFYTLSSYRHSFLGPEWLFLLLLLGNSSPAMAQLNIFSLGKLPHHFPSPSPVGRVSHFFLHPPMVPCSLFYVGLRYCNEITGLHVSHSH